MASEQKAMSRGGCGCSSKAVAAGPETPVKKSGCCGGGDAHDHNHHAAGRAGVVDPVCGMTVDPATSKHRFDFRGVTYHFCSAGCQTTFAA
ncbi:YHS domain-containing protein, partial [Enterococcus faecalis]|uniref:YHS domain-containing protein n=2 Tax=Bacteria TaxID=2 RepID=UPI00403F148D